MVDVLVIFTMTSFSVCLDKMSVFLVSFCGHRVVGSMRLSVSNKTKNALSLVLKGSPTNTEASCACQTSS